jgi:hypothetical protein
MGTQRRVHTHRGGDDWHMLIQDIGNGDVWTTMSAEGVTFRADGAFPADPWSVGLLVLQELFCADVPQRRVGLGHLAGRHRRVRLDGPEHRPHVPPLR